MTHTQTRLTMSSLSQYRIVGALGGGSFGNIYKVSRITDGRAFVMTQIRTSEMGLAARHTAISEVHVLASLESALVVRYYDTFFDGEILCVVMELCDRGDLQRLIRKQREIAMPLSERLIWTCLLQIVAGVGFLHSKRIIHRWVRCDRLDFKVGLLIYCHTGTWQLRLPSQRSQAFQPLSVLWRRIYGEDWLRSDSRGRTRLLCRELRSRCDRRKAGCQFNLTICHMICQFPRHLRLGVNLLPKPSGCCLWAWQPACSLVQRRLAVALSPDPSCFRPLHVQEVCENGPCSEASDMWAVGCIIYELCMLRPAFEGRSLGAQILKVRRGATLENEWDWPYSRPAAQIVRAEFTPIGDRYSSLLSDVIGLLLSRDPRARPRAADLLRDERVRAHTGALGLGVVLPAAAREFIDALLSCPAASEGGAGGRSDGGRRDSAVGVMPVAAAASSGGSRLTASETAGAAEGKWNEDNGERRFTDGKVGESDEVSAEAGVARRRSETHGRVARHVSRDAPQWQRRPQGEAQVSVGAYVRDSAARELAALECAVAAAAPCEDPQEPSSPGQHAQESWLGVGRRSVGSGAPGWDEEEDPALSATLPGPQAEIGAEQALATRSVPAGAGISLAAGTSLLRMGVPSPVAEAMHDGPRRGELPQRMQRTLSGAAVAAPHRHTPPPSAPTAAEARAVASLEARATAPAAGSARITRPGGAREGGEGVRVAQSRASAASAASGSGVSASRDNRRDRVQVTGAASLAAPNSGDRSFLPSIQTQRGGIIAGGRLSLLSPLGSSLRPAAASVTVCRQLEASNARSQPDLLLCGLPVASSVVAVRRDVERAGAPPMDSSGGGGGCQCQCSTGTGSVDDEYADESFEALSSLSPPYDPSRRGLA